MSEDLIKLGAVAAHRLLPVGELTSPFQLVGAAARRIIEPDPRRRPSQRTVAL